MGKYRVNISYSLQAQLEPDGYITGLDRAGEDLIEIDESNSFYGETLECSGGDVYLTVEAGSEDQAGFNAQTIFENNATWEDNSGDWEIVDVSVYEVEVIEEPMTLTRALSLIEAYLDGELQSGRIDAETRTAFDFILGELMKLRAKEVAGQTS